MTLDADAAPRSPDVGELCSAGERAFADDDFEEAEAWYELACAGRYKTVYVRGDTREVVAHPKEALIANRFVRWEQLRAMMYQRSVRRLARPDPGHVLIVQTTVASYRRTNLDLRQWAQWPHVRTLVADGMGTGVLQGQAKTFFKVLAYAATLEPFTALTLLEDDVVLAKNALDYIATTKVDDDLAFISWFSTYSYAGPRLPPLFHCIEARDYQYNQAITFPARTVHELLASDALKNWAEPHGADRIYRDVFPDRKVGVHYPNLVQHVGGTESLVGNSDQGPRVSLSFIGEDVDALSLIDR